jgi:hypothetical protein
MNPPLMTGPIALYNNVPIQSQFYVPSQFFISAISLGQTTTITTTVNHNYVMGQECRLLIPMTNGTIQLNQQTGFVISIPNPNQVVLNIVSQGDTPFNSTTLSIQPQITAIGNINTGVINNPINIINGIVQTGTSIPGSFINVSPFA